MQFNASVLQEQTGLSADDVTDALYELRAFFIDGGGEQYLASSSLYTAFDRHFMDYDPAGDALKLAADLVNDPTFPHKPDLITERYGWTPSAPESGVDLSARSRTHRLSRKPLQRAIRAVYGVQF